MRERTRILMGAVLGALAAYSVILTTVMLRNGVPGPVQAALASESAEPESFSSAIAVQEAFREVSARVLPSVVEISVKAENTNGEDEDGEIPWNEFFSDPSEESESPRFFRSHGLGSGVIVENIGETHYVMTNAHVVGPSPEEITVELYDGDTVTAELVGTDERKDLAILRFELDDPKLRTIPIGDSDRLYVGDWVLAYGSPYGYEQSASSGIVSALGRRDGPGENINDFIQTDAAINQGNSGGALVNIHGELIGINTFITTPNGGSIGLGFAIPVNNAVSAMRQLIDTGEVRYGWLGVSLGAFGPEAAESLGYPEDAGAMVYQVFEGSPAEEAGLRPGDLIEALDGHPFADVERLIYRIGDKAPEAEAVFTVNRLGRTLSITAVMGEREGEDAVREMHGRARPGFVAAPLTADVREAMGLPADVFGTPVAEVYPRTTAQSADLRAGDIIMSISGIPVENLRGLYEALAQADPMSMTFTVLRDGAVVELDGDKGVPE